MPLFSSAPRGTTSEKVALNDGKPAAPKHLKDWPNEAGFNADIEFREPKELVVQGRIPPEVAGTLYRTGPGHYQVPDTPHGTYKLSHWFDGFSHVHRFQIIHSGQDSCKVLYNSRRQVDPLLDSIRKTGKLGQVSFGQKRDPCAGLFGKLKSVFDPTVVRDPYFTNTGVTITENPSGTPKRPNIMILKTDNSLMKEIDKETLEPLGVVDQSKLHPALKGVISCAHAEYDHETGDMFNSNLEFGMNCTYRIFKSNLATGKTEVIATISNKNIPPAYIHSFCMTKDFVILAVWGANFKSGGAQVLWERNILDVLTPVDPNSKVKWLVVDRRNGKGLVASFDGPPGFSFHSINAWQEPSSDGKSEDIYCDIVEYKTTDILHKLYYENLISSSLGAPKYASGKLQENCNMYVARYRLGNVPAAAAKASKPGPVGVAEVLFELPNPKVGELPTINPAFSTKKHRYVYSIIDRGYSSWADGLAKADLETKEAIYWSEKGHTPGEPIFVADKTKDGEDDGYLLSVVLNGIKGTSYLLCLDAKTMKEIGRAECEVPVGFGFHGTHIAPKLT